jgi:hypothetical protein
VKRRTTRSDAILSPRSFLDPQPSLASDSEATDRSSSLSSMPQASAAPAQQRDLVNRCIDASINVGFEPMPIAEQGPFEARRCSNPFTILQDCELFISGSASFVHQGSCSSNAGAVVSGAICTGCQPVRLEMHHVKPHPSTSSRPICSQQAATGLIDSLAKNGWCRQLLRSIISASTIHKCTSESVSHIVSIRFGDAGIRGGRLELC